MRRNAPRLPWRKLLTNPPLSWQLLPVVTRGIGTEILRHLDNSLSLPIGTETPHVAVCRMLGAHVRERRTVKAAIDELIKRGLLVLEGDDEARCLKARIPDLEEYEDTTVARRQRDTDTTVARQCDDSGTTMARQPNRLNSTESFNTTPVDKIREEEIREEHTEARARVSVLSGLSSGLSSNLDSVVRELTRGYQARYEKHANDAWMAAAQNRREIQSVAAYVAAVPGETSEVVADVLDGFFASEWATKERWPWRALAKNPGSYRPDRTAEREAAARRKRWDEHAAREAARQAELAKQPQEPSRVMAPEDIEKMTSNLLARLSQSTAMPTTKPKRKPQEAAE